MIIEAYKSGSLSGFRYRFEAAGECIPTHEHPPELTHNIIVLKGVVAFGAQLLAAGTVHDFDGAVPHSIVAVEPQTEILNLYLNGEPIP